MSETTGAEMPEWVRLMKEAMWRMAPTAKRLFAEGTRTTMVQCAIASRRGMHREAWTKLVRAELQKWGVLDDLHEEFGLSWKCIPVYKPDSSDSMYLKLAPAHKEGAGRGGSDSPRIDVQF